MCVGLDSLEDMIEQQPVWPRAEMIDVGAPVPGQTVSRHCQTITKVQTYTDHLLTYHSMHAAFRTGTKLTQALMDCERRVLYSVDI